MKVETNTQAISETNENNIKIEPEDEAMLTPTMMPFAQMISGAENIFGIEGSSGNFSSSDFTDFDSMLINEDDARFFINLAQSGEYFVSIPNDKSGIQIMEPQVVQNTVSAKTVEITNQLASLIEKAQSTQKPVRISFDNDVSVILKIDKNGKVNAEFIPGSLEAESYIRNNISSLKQKFDEENLPYNELYYRQSGKQGGKQNKKEK